MSAVPRHPRDLGYAGMRMSADEYLALGETQERCELIDGVVVMSPSPLPRHNRVLSKIVYQLEHAAAQQGGLEVFPETDLRLDAQTVYRPDISIYRTGRLPHDVQQLDIPPDLVIEILSPGSKALDLITKRDDYERFGVAEYWTVEPSSGDVRCWQRQRARLYEVPVEGDALPSTALPGFILQLSPVRAVASQP